MTMMTEFDVSRVSVEERWADIISVKRRNIKDMSAVEFVWKYIQGPFGRAHTWIASRKNSGDAIGAASIFPREVYVRGVPVLGAIAGDFSIDKEFRSIPA